MRDELLASVYSPQKTKEPWRLEDKLPGYDLRYFSYGRRALAQGLLAAGLKPGDKVLLPEFICRDLLSSLAAVGASPVFYPVAPDLSPAVEPSRWPEARAVVAVDYFGFPQELSPFREYCRRTGAVLIEDNAHGLFSRDEAGLPLGARADLGVFSLRKTLALPDGAALALKTGARDWQTPPQQPFRSGATLRQRARGMLRLLAGSFGAPPAFTLLRSFRTVRGLWRGSGPSGGPDAETRLPEPGLPFAALSAPLRVADPDLETRRRRTLYRRMEAFLAPRFPPVFKTLPGGVVPYAFVFRSGGRDAEAARILARQSLAHLPWPDLPSALEASAPAHYRDIRLVHFLW